MTTEDRAVTLKCLWRQLEGLVGRTQGRQLSELHTAIEAQYNDHGDERYVMGHTAGRQSALKALEDERHAAFCRGMLAVEQRADRRDEADVQDPEELRSVH